MCKVSEQIERKKKNVENPSRERIVPPKEKGKGILHD